ncbi:hypothetical protein T11_738, partial [Trichinella zimbabwensis]
LLAAMKRKEKIVTPFKKAIEYISFLTNLTNLLTDFSIFTLLSIYQWSPDTTQSNTIQANILLLFEICKCSKAKQGKSCISCTERVKVNSVSCIFSVTSSRLILISRLDKNILLNSSFDCAAAAATAITAVDFSSHIQLNNDGYYFKKSIGLLAVEILSKQAFRTTGTILHN